MIRSSVSSEDVVDWRKWDGGRRRLQKQFHDDPFWYSFDAGPVHFIMANTELPLNPQFDRSGSISPPSPQWTWLVPTPRNMPVKCTQSGESGRLRALALHLIEGERRLNVGLI